jgi:hypothetical protein
LKGEQSHKEFWAVDLRSGAERALTELGPGQVIGDFDVAADGRTIVFDRAAGGVGSVVDRARGRALDRRLPDNQLDGRQDPRLPCRPT